MNNRRLSILRWLLLLILLYAVIFSALSVLKHNRFHSFTLDLGIMSQVTWNTAHGRPFETSLDRARDTTLVGSYMGNHVRPIFLLLAPFYRLWPDPRLLLILQSIALALGVIPLFWIARQRLRSKKLRFGLMLSYLLYPALGFINLFDFHPVAFCVPALLFAYWALQEDRTAFFWAMILLTLSTKEELVVPVAAFGVYCLAHPRWRKTGVRLIIVSAIWAFVCFFIIIPYCNEGRSYRFFKLWVHLLPWSGLGAGSSGGLNVFSVEAVYFLIHLLLPLGFLPLLAPKLLAVSLPSLAYLLLSSRSALHTVGFQYPAVLIPWLFLAALQGLTKLESMMRKRERGGEWLLSALLVFGTVGANIKFNPIVTAHRSGYFSRLPHRRQIHTALAQIPPQAGVATVNPLGPHLVHRRYLIALEKYHRHLRHDHLRYVDYVLLDLVDCRLFHTQDPRSDYADMVHEILDTQQFDVRYWSGRVLLLERGEPSAQALDDVRAYVDKLEAEGRPCWP